MKQIMDLQYLGYSSGPSRNLGVKERWMVIDGERERGEGGRGKRWGRLQIDLLVLHQSLTGVWF